MQPQEPHIAQTVLRLGDLSLVPVHEMYWSALKTPKVTLAFKLSLRN